MTKRCCYCNPPHIMGPDNGAPYSDGLCRLAYFRESVKILVQYELPMWWEKFLDRSEAPLNLIANVISVMGVVFLVAVLVLLFR